MENDATHNSGALGRAEPTFAALVRAGRCKPEEIEDYIDRWHDEYTGPLPLHEYLGLTKKQFAAWALPPHRLRVGLERRIAGGVPVKRDTDFFRRLRSCGKRGGKALYRDSKGFYYQWDSLHGEWEKFNKAGWHAGVLDAEGINFIKDPKPNRRINL